jgi:hypothetical protein
MDSVIYDPRVEKLKRELFVELAASKTSSMRMKHALGIETAGKRIFKAVHKRGKSTR